MSHLFWYSCNIYSTLLSVVFTRVSARPCGPPRKHLLKIKREKKMSFLFRLPVNSCEWTVILVKSRNSLFIFSYVGMWFSSLAINFLTNNPSFSPFRVLLVGGIFFKSQIFWYPLNSYLQCKSLGLPKCKRMTEAIINNVKKCLKTLTKCDEI